MATFTYTVDRGFQRTIKPRVQRVAFGDGYEQRAADGINSQPRSYQVSFNNRADAEADGIDAFLIARGGVEAFDWAPPDGTAAGKFVCREWTRAHVSAGFWNIGGTFEEVFEA